MSIHGKLIGPYRPRTRDVLSELGYDGAAAHVVAPVGLQYRNGVAMPWSTSEDWRLVLEAITRDDAAYSREFRRPVRVLVDMDDVVAEWGVGYDSLLDEHGEAAAGIPRRAERMHWDLYADRTPAERRIIQKIMVEPGFYGMLRAVPGARTALRQMRDAGYDIRFVSAPYISNPTCASDKIAWIARHYGSHWAQRVILTTDKTLVRGDYLIDDRPDITGGEEPSWEHVLFTQPYNKHIEDRRRISSWSEWRNIL